MARTKMADAGVDPVAIETFAHYYRLLEYGETGLIAQSSIEPVDIERLADVDVPSDVAADALRQTAIIKLNGGLGTSMGMDRAKSLLCVRRGLSFLDIIARQVLHLREKYDAPLPLLFMNSFPHPRRHPRGTGPLREPQGPGPAARLPAEQGTRACWSRAWSRRPTRRTPTSSGARPATATSTPPCAAAGYESRSSSRASGTSSSPTPTTSERCRRPRWRGGSPRVGHRSRSRRSAVLPRTRRAATSPAARPMAGWSCVRPPRQPKRTSRCSPTSSGTGSRRPTTSGSTSTRSATPSTSATACSDCR